MSIFGKEGVSERVRSWATRAKDIRKLLKNKDMRDDPDMLVRNPSKFSESTQADTLFQNRVVRAYANTDIKHDMPDFKDRIFTQEVKYLEGKKLGIRNEGDYPTSTPNADISLFHRFKPASEYNDNKAFENYIGNSSKLNKIEIGPIGAFASTDSISPVYSAVVKHPLFSSDGPKMKYVDNKGVTRKAPIGNNQVPPRLKGDSYGGFFGGHVILKGKKGLSIVSGSPNFISNEMREQSFDGKGLIEVFYPDNGTYNFPLKKTTPINKSDLRNWDLQNETGGTFGYIR